MNLVYLTVYIYSINSLCLLKPIYKIDLKDYINQKVFTVFIKYTKWIRKIKYTMDI